MKCEICNKETKNIKGLSIHLSKYHKGDDLQNYYDEYIGEKQYCYFCGDDAIFKNITNGYSRICSSEKCLGKTRATGTYQFLMYKYNLNKEDALELQKERALKRGKKIKESFNKLLENDKNYNKKRCRTSIEHWKNKGLSDEESKYLSNKYSTLFWTTALETKKENKKSHPDIYSDINPTQLNYWIKKGYNLETSKKKLKERQTTNTLKNYQKKYGVCEGMILFENRKIEWSKEIEKQFRNGNFSKTSSSNYSKTELELFKIITDRINIKNYYSGLNDKQFFKRYDGKTYSYDFVYGKKVIEFNGDYWHCNPKKYNEIYWQSHRQMTAKEIWLFDEKKINSIKNDDFDVLIIWESDYKTNSEQIIEKCINFLEN